MGKRLIQQARGKGGPTYRAPSFRYVGKPMHAPIGNLSGTVEEIVHCQGHSAPLAHVAYENNTRGLVIAPEGMYVGQPIVSSQDKPTEVRPGDMLPLSAVPEGTLVHNIEQVPGDGGKFVRASGTSAKIIGHQDGMVTVILPSKKTKIFNGKCRASVGTVAGGGRPEKPLLKAGTAMFKARARNKLYPSVTAACMNAVDHPFGNKRSSRKSKARPTSRNAPPGRKVGAIAARRTGRKKK